MAKGLNSKQLDAMIAYFRYFVCVCVGGGSSEMHTHMMFLKRYMTDKFRVVVLGSVVLLKQVVNVLCDGNNFFFFFFFVCVILIKDEK